MTEREARAELAKRVGHSLSEFIDDYAPLNERRYVMGAEHVLKKFGLVEAAPSDTDQPITVTNAMSDEYECCASGSCEVCRRPSGYSSEERDRINRERDSYDPPWVRQHEREGWHQ